MLTVKLLVLEVRGDNMIFANTSVHVKSSNGQITKCFAGDLVVGDRIVTLADLNNKDVGYAESEVERIDQVTVPKYYKLGTLPVAEGTPLWAYDWRDWVNVANLEPQMILANGQSVMPTEVEEEGTFLYIKTTPGWYTAIYDHFEAVEMHDQEGNRIEDSTINVLSMAIINGNHRE